MAALALCSGVPVAAAESPADAAKPQEHFDVTEYRVLGNTVLPNIEIERVLYPLLGRSKVIGDVEKARAALEGRYRERGYGTVFVDIPEQEVAEGIVRLRVTEGSLAHTRVVGARYFSGRTIRAALPAAAESSVPHLPTLQAELAALNMQTTDRSVTPVLKAGAKPGTVDLALNVHEELPLHGSLELNDQYTTDTSKLRVVGALRYDDLFGRLDSLALQYQTSPQQTSEVKVWAAAYTRRLTNAGTSLAFSYISSDSDVATVGEGDTTVQVLGKSKIYTVRLVSPLVATPVATHLFVAGLEYKDVGESIFSTLDTQTPISYINVALGHISAWRSPARQWSLATTLNLGIRGRFNEPDEFAFKRYLAKPNYFMLRSQAALTTTLPWKLSLRLRAAGQYALDSIISNEQFSIAGADGVRGYREAELLGDVGIKSSLELSSPHLSMLNDRLQGDTFLFFDYGRMTRLNPLRELDPSTGLLGNLLEQPNATLRSVGAGIEFSLWQHVDGQLIWAYPLADVGTDAGTLRGDSRFEFSVRTTW